MKRPEGKKPADETEGSVEKGGERGKVEMGNLSLATMKIMINTGAVEGVTNWRFKCVFVVV